MPLITYPATPNYLTTWKYVFDKGSISLSYILVRQPKNIHYNIKGYKLSSVEDISITSNEDMGFSPPTVNILKNNDDFISFYIECYSPSVCCKGDTNEPYYAKVSFVANFKRKCCDLSSGLNKILGVLGG